MKDISVRKQVCNSSAPSTPQQRASPSLQRGVTRHGGARWVAFRSFVGLLRRVFMTDCRWWVWVNGRRPLMPCPSSPVARWSRGDVKSTVRTQEFATYLEAISSFKHIYVPIYNSWLEHNGLFLNWGLGLFPFRNSQICA